MNNTRGRAFFEDTEQITRGAARPCALFRVAAIRENRRNRDVKDAARGAGNSVFQMGSLPIQKTDTIPRGHCAKFYKALTRTFQSPYKALSMKGLCTDFARALKGFFKNIVRSLKGRCKGFDNAFGDNAYVW